MASISREAVKAARNEFRMLMGATEATVNTVGWWETSPLFGEGNAFSAFNVGFTTDRVEIRQLTTLKRGHATAKLQALFEICRKAGYTEIHLDDAGPSGFWAHYGFVKNPSGWDHSSMIKRLS